MLADPLVKHDSAFLFVFVTARLDRLFIPRRYTTMMGKLIHLCFIGGQMSGDRHNNQEFNQLILDALSLKKRIF